MEEESSKREEREDDFEELGDGDESGGEGGEDGEDELEKFVNDYGKPVNLKELSKEELNEYFYDLCYKPSSATLDVIRECFEFGADLNYRTKYTRS